MAEPVLFARPVRERLVLALDVADLDAATALARRLKPWFAVVKVGLELYVAEGPAAVAAFTGEGFDVFVDLKLHDIPTTVRRAARAIARTGARYATVHAAGGADMLAAAADGFLEGAGAGRDVPTIGLAITVLTSDPEATPALVIERALLAFAGAVNQGVDGRSAGAALRAHHQRRLAGEGGEGRFALRGFGDVPRQRRLADPGVAEQPKHLRLARLEPSPDRVERVRLLGRPLRPGERSFGRDRGSGGGLAPIGRAVRLPALGRRAPPRQPTEIDLGAAMGANDRAFARIVKSRAAGLASALGSELGDAHGHSRARERRGPGPRVGEARRGRRPS